MTQPYPLPRDLRQSSVDLGDGGATYGPFAFKIFDTDDVEAWTLTDAAGAMWTKEEGLTVTKTNGDPFDTFSVTFAAALAPTTQYVVYGRRLQERSTAVTRGGSINSNELEKELSKLSVVADELRRDVDRGYRAAPGGSGGQVIAIAAGHFWKADADGNMVDGGSVDAITEARNAAAESATAAAGSASTASASATEADGSAEASRVSSAAAAASASAAAAAAAGVNLPAVTADDAGEVLAVKADGSGYETISHRTRARVALTTFYVRPDGDDNNDGSADTAAGAFREIAAAVDFAWDNLDLASHLITIEVADGSYSKPIQKEYPAVGGSRITVHGNSDNPENVVLSVGPSDNAVRMYHGATIYLDGLKVEAGQRGLYTAWGGTIYFQNVDFGTCGSYHMRASAGHIWLIGTMKYTISGGAPVHWYPHIGGTIDVTAGDVTILNTPNFSQAFATYETGGSVEANAISFSGSATGPKYIANIGGSMNLGAAYPWDVLPGNSEGKPNRGGLSPEGIFNGNNFFSQWSAHSISDDAADGIDLSKLSSGIILVTINCISGGRSAVPAGQFRLRTVGTPFIEDVSLDLTAVVLTTGTLAGTTGTDGKVTISAASDGKLYVENRSGSARQFSLSFLV
jgi:hypothetical protein